MAAAGAVAALTAALVQLWQRDGEARRLTHKSGEEWELYSDREPQFKLLANLGTYTGTVFLVWKGAANRIFAVAWT